MPVQLLVRCDSPGCESYEATPVGQPPVHWLNINGAVTLCSWTCLAIYAANMAGLEKDRAEQAQAEAPEADVEPEAPPAEPVGAASPT